MTLSFDFKARSSAVLLIASLQAACAAPNLAPMDPSRPIETERGYRQGGVPLDRGIMLDHLDREAAAGPHARRSKTIGTIAIVLSGIGGFLIGWPVGEKLIDKDPNWTLAYVGAGTIGVALPLGLWADASTGQAVEEHNRSLASGASSDRAPTRAR